MAKSIVVFGGSFNPPTLAHERLLAAAMEGVGADTGIFVPSNDAYVTKKMAKTDWPAEVLPERTRSAMLRAVCRSRENGGFALDEGEYGYSGTSGNSLDTMKRVQAVHPEAERLYFLFGGDKLKVFTKWKTFREFCSSFGIIVFAREGFDPAYEIAHTKALKEFSDSFVILPAPEGIGEISSTAVRDAVRAGEEEGARSMLRPEVFELLRGSPIRKQTAITSFRGHYAFLSNFYAAEVAYEGLTYPTSEAAFQAAKCLDPEERVPFTEQKNPVVVKRMGRGVKLRPGWDGVKLGIMEKIVRAKFTQHPELAERLVATGALPIMEGNSWHDTFWGVDASTGRGENHLGQILMKVRQELGGEGDTSDENSFLSARAGTPARLPAAEARSAAEARPAARPAGETAPAQTAEEPETVYEPGMTLLHPTFGKGTVVSVSGAGNSRIIGIEFPVGLKRLGAAWADKNCKKL